ncbi:hypothetical protein FAIPA1_230079 [Frankia sp. AiPs1]
MHRPPVARMQRLACGCRAEAVRRVTVIGSCPVVVKGGGVVARWFNTAGPCVPSDHYMIPAAARLPEVSGLVEQKGYFVVHAPRQTGKTTTLMALAQELTASHHEVSAAFGEPVAVDVGLDAPAGLGQGLFAAGVGDQVGADVVPPGKSGHEHIA